MIRRIVWGGKVVVSVLLAAMIAKAQVSEPSLPRLKNHVEILASPDFAGRREAGAVKTRSYLLEEFRKLHLEPLFAGSFTQHVMGKGPEEVIGVNVGVRIEGSDPGLRDRWIILGVHYDHLGVHEGVIYPGADDNASGVAMMLEVARSIAESPSRPRRSIALVGFDLEERGPNGEFGLRGSQFFARHSPIPLDKVNLFITADMIGRALGGVCEKMVFVLGSEHVPEVRPWVTRAAETKPIEVGLLGSDLLVIDRSDYGPFRSRKIPYLFFTTGENPLYHSPKDVAATIDYPKLETISRMINEVVRQALDGEINPTWSTQPDNPVAEALAVRSVIRMLLEHKDELKLGGSQVAIMGQTIKTVDEIERRGSMTTSERRSIARTAQLIIMTAF